jgi:hypothetical protein
VGICADLGKPNITVFFESTPLPMVAAKVNPQETIVFSMGCLM